VESTAAAAKRLWGLCNVLRDDGITYHQYISELTLILFFKLANQLGIEGDIPTDYRWTSLVTLEGERLLATFQDAIKVLANSPNQSVSALFIDNKTSIRNGTSLERLVHGIDAIDWHDIEPSSLGDIYESLIDRNAQESRYGAGQYFTPRALVEAMVRVMAPTREDSVYDPAAGTAGFLVAAGIHAVDASGQQCGLRGNELVHEVQRMGLMNLHLHGLKAELANVDTLSLPLVQEKYSLCLSNPPFGIRSDLNPMQRSHLMFPTSNKQLSFLQHIYSCMRVGGRTAAVFPDNVLFEAGVAAAIRTYLLDNFNLHTLLRLPTGIFYATGVKTSVLFFSRTGPTRETWVYDLRFGNNGFTRKRPLAIDDLTDFITSFGPDPMGSSPRTMSSHFRSISRSTLRDLDDRLDVVGVPAPESRHGSATATLEMISRELDQAAAAAKELQIMLEQAGREIE
jgi:type I restriction enzyme M protein